MGEGVSLLRSSHPPSPRTGTDGRDRSDEPPILDPVTTLLSGAGDGGAGSRSSSHSTAAGPASFLEMLAAYPNSSTIEMPSADRALLLAEGNCGPLAFANVGWVPHSCRLGIKTLSGTLWRREDGAERLQPSWCAARAIPRLSLGFLAAVGQDGCVH